MLSEYLLKHKNHTCGLILIDADDGKLLRFTATDSSRTPFLGNATLPLMKKWWEARAVPGSRKMMLERIRQAGCENQYEYLAKNLGLSLTDAWWICPVEETLRWEDVNFFKDIPGQDEKLPYHSADSYDPNASLGGQMDKYWDLSTAPPTLVKTAYRAYGQQSINEAFATRLHKAQKTEISFVDYSLEKTADGGIRSRCALFTSEKTEFLSAFEVVSSKKSAGDRSVYDSFIDLCEECGLPREDVQKFMDYQTLTDFIISNTDEHLMNFGVLRDTQSLRLLAPAPVFDSGNSMFYADERNHPYTRKDILARSITAFHDKEEKMLAHVKHKDIVKPELLPSPRSVKSFYVKYGLPEERADFIAKSYAVKLDLLHDFQRGITISLYHEKRRR
ncbi:MAG: HipA domain-containing protein [Lachnospiraceae bacterium]|nr:HipA domain-containing protein [Lachnospiraceae bacterium]